MRSLGILGGTFDPVHFGHLRLAVEMQERLDLSDGVRLLPAAVPALRDAPGCSPSLRLEMLVAAVADAPGLAIDDRELHRDGTSYTVDTLESLRAELPQASLCFIVGMDAFARFDRWHRWRDILELANIAIARRPRATFPDNVELSKFVADHAAAEPVLGRSLAGHVCVVDVPLLDISATYVRELVAKGRSPRYLVPQPVACLIEQHGAYSGNQ